MDLKDSDDVMSHLCGFSTHSVRYNRIKDTALRRQNPSLWVVASNSFACRSLLSRRFKKGTDGVSETHSFTFNCCIQQDLTDY